MRPVLLVDADYIVYSAGFATESVEYEMRAKLATGEVVEDVCDSKDAATAWREGRDWPLGTKHFEPQRLVTAEPLSHAKLILRNIFKKIRSEAGAHFGEDPIPFVYLTGGHNFRNDVATIKPYKGNRKTLHKPIHYAALREYIVEKYKGKVVDVVEADDAVAMHAASLDYSNNVLIAAVDKDLWTVPGWHYNFQKDTFENVSHEAALRNFYMQLLTGDPVDNIGGCYKCGEKRARQALEGLTSESEMYAAALREYELSFERKGCPYAELTPKTALAENARLLHMLRHPRDIWTPPGHALRKRVEAAMREDSWKTSITEGSFTSTNPLPIVSLSQSPDSSVPSAGQPSPEKPATPRISGSAGTTSGSKRKGSSRLTTKGGSSHSMSST